MAQLQQPACSVSEKDQHACALYCVLQNIICTTEYLEVPTCIVPVQGET